MSDVCSFQVSSHTPLCSDDDLFTNVYLLGWIVRFSVALDRGRTPECKLSCSPANTTFCAVVPLSRRLFANGSAHFVDFYRELAVSSEAFLYGISGNAIQ